MRILFVTQIVPYPPHGGVLQRGYNLLRELGRKHDVHLLAFLHSDELRTPEAVAESQRELLKFCRSVEYFDLWPKRSRLHTLMALALGLLYSKPFSVLAQRNASLERRIAEICASGSIDVVHLDTIALAPLRRHCAGLPVVLAHHNIESQLMQRRSEHESSLLARAYVHLQARRLLRYERDQCGLFGINVTVSEADAAMLRRICPGSRAEVVPNGVDTEYFTPLGTGDSPSMIYTGGMNMFANRDAVEWFLDEIWPLVRKSVPDARFLAVGQRPSARVITATEQDAAVIAPGFVNDIRPLVASAAVYVVPLRVGGGTRLKMVDAMAQGKAIVATSLGAEGILGTPGVHYLIADTPEQFASTVVQLLRDAGRRQALGSAARELAVRKYSWHRLGEVQAEIYERAIAGTSS